MFCNFLTKAVLVSLWVVFVAAAAANGSFFFVNAAVFLSLHHHRHRHHRFTVTRKAISTAQSSSNNNEEDQSASSLSSSKLLVPRLSLDEFDPNKAMDRPLLIANALSPDRCEACLDLVMQHADDLIVDLQQQTYRSDSDSDEQTNAQTQLLECTLDQAIGVIMHKSNSKQAFLAFCEGLLRQETTAGTLSTVQDEVTRAREAVFAGSGGADGAHCWFANFPKSMQPTDAVILAGAGATSTLHRDPFEWTGTSLCLEGTKVWRLIEPPPEGIRGDDGGGGGVRVVDQQLESFRLESNAWQPDDDDEKTSTAQIASSLSLSAGWQSGYSLYHTRQHDLIPSARELAELQESDASQYEDLLTELATDMQTLRPNMPNHHVANNLQIHTAIQRPGDLLLIPAHWWHQTYALEPSVAVASQRCSQWDAPLVFQHILDQVLLAKKKSKNSSSHQISNTTAKSILEDASTPQEAIQELFNVVNSSR